MALGGDGEEIRGCCLCHTFIVVIMLTGFLVLEGYYSISAHCTGVLLWPMLSLFIFLLLILILGYFNDISLMLLHLIGIVLTIVALAAFIVFGYVAVGGCDFNLANNVREYNLTGYRGSWLKHRVVDPQRWAEISACIRRRHACGGMTDLVRDPKTGIYIPLSRWENGGSPDSRGGPEPIQVGCCMPPASCGFTYVNGTTWVPTPGASPPVRTNADCSRWSSDQLELCFECDSCKAALLDENRKAWTIAVAFPIATLVLLILLFYYYLVE